MTMKNSEIGLIPEGWKATRIGELFDIGAGGDLDKSNFSSIRDEIHGVPIYANGLSDKGLYGFSSYSNREAGSLTVTARGTLGSANYRNQPFVAIGRLLVLKPKEKDHDGRFFAEYLNAKVRFASESTGVPQLTAPQVAQYWVAEPPSDEQTAIADVLEDIDCYLNKLDLLITKKRDIKKGAMQELLTGKRRLPGFQKPWGTRWFEEIAQPRKTRLDPRKSGQAQFCIELEHIEPETGAFLGNTETSETSSLKTVFQNGDVLFGKLRAYLRKHALAGRSGLCSTEIWALVPNIEKVTSEYLFQLVKTDAFIEVASTSYGTHMPRSDWNVVKKFEVSLPEIEEQNAIASVLMDLDSEIAALRVQRDKTAALKQGMMQQLLTGKIRLT